MWGRQTGEYCMWRRQTGECWIRDSIGRIVGKACKCLECTSLGVKSEKNDISYYFILYVV